MLKSKATAALLRLKEIDRKYKNKQKEDRQTRFDVSTDSSLHSPSTPPRFVSQPSTNANGTDGVQSVSKAKLEIQMPNTYITYTHQDSPTEDKTSTPFITIYKKTSKNAHSSRSESSSTTTIQVQNMRGRLSSLDSARNSDQLSPEVTSVRSEKSIADYEKKSITDTFADEAILTEAEYSSGFSVLTEFSNTHSYKRSETSDNEISTKESKIKKEISGKAEVISIDSTSVNVKEIQDASQRKKSLSNSTKLDVKTMLLNTTEMDTVSNTKNSNDIEADHQLAKALSDNYTNDTFEEVSTSIIITVQDEQKYIDAISEGSEKSLKDGVAEQTMLDRQKVHILSRNEYAADQNNTIDDSKELIEIVTPKVMEKVSECEVDLDKDLSEYVKSITSDEILSPISLLKSPTSKNVNKKSRKKSTSYTETFRDSVTDSKSRKDSINAVKKSADDTVTNNCGHKKTLSDRKFSSKSDRSTTNSATSNISRKKKHSLKKVSTSENGEDSSLSSTLRSKASPTPDNELINIISTETEETLESKNAVQNIMLTNGVPPQMKRQISQATRRIEWEGKLIGKEGGDIRQKGGNEDSSSSTMNVDKPSLLGVGDNTQHKNDNHIYEDHLTLRNTRKVSLETTGAAGVLRKLNKDVIEVINKRCEANEKILSSNRSATKGTKTIFKISTDRKKRAFDEDFKTVKNYESTRERSRRNAKKSNKCAQNCRFSKSEDKCLGLDKKQIQRLRRQMNTLKLHEQRESLRSYIDRLKYTSSEVTSADRKFIKPLHFPKIEEFISPDLTDATLKSNDNYALLRERLLAIKQRLKDQMLFYHNYSNLAQKINEGYVPTTLADVKKIIREHHEKTCETRLD